MYRRETQEEGHEDQGGIETIGPTEEEEGHPICKGVSGWVAEGIKWWIYDATIMVDLEDEERIGIQDLDLSLVDPARGMAVNNSLVLSTTIRNTLDLAEIPNDWKAQAYWWQYDDDALKSSTFAYTTVRILSPGCPWTGCGLTTR